MPAAKVSVSHDTSQAFVSKSYKDLEPSTSLPAFKYYLFDVDGCLIDTAELITSCFQTFFRDHMNRTPPSREQALSLIGRPLRKQFAIFMGKDELSSEEFEFMDKKYQAIQMQLYKTHSKLFENVKEVLGELRRRGARCAVVTSRRLLSLSKYFNHFGLWSYFDVIATPEATSKHKPHPEPCEFALRELMRLSGDSRSLEEGQKDSIMVGDALFDVMSGHDAGLSTAFVQWSLSPVSIDELGDNVTYYIDSMNAFLGTYDDAHDKPVQ